MQDKDHSRRSLLQVEILIQLEEQPAKTISELAERVDALRPSVSRSLHTLKEQGLVHRERSGWHLTESGRAKSLAAKDQLIEVTEKAQAMAERASGTWSRVGLLPNLGKAIDVASRFANLNLPDTSTVFANLMKSVDTSAAFANLVGSFDTVDMFSNLINVSDTASMFGHAIKPLIEAQERNSALLNDSVTAVHIAAFGGIAKQNNIFLARAIDDVLAIRQSSMVEFATAMHNSFDFSWISGQLAQVNQSFENLFRYHMEHINRASLHTPFPLLASRITVPTATVAYYTDSLRDLVEAETEAEISPLPSRGVAEFGDQSLDPILSKLNPDFVEMRHGSWSALQMAGPDRLRHAGTSQRELLTQVLQHFVPDLLLPEDSRQGPQIKGRVKIALGGSDSDAEFVDVLAKALLSYYRQLNKYTHHNEKHEASLRALLRAGEGLLLFMLLNMSVDFNK